MAVWGNEQQSNRSLDIELWPAPPTNASVTSLFSEIKDSFVFVRQKKHQKMSLGKISFRIRYFSKTSGQTSEKKLKSNVRHEIKRSPHGKI